MPFLFYPYTLQKRTLTGWETVSKCRDSPSGAGKDVITVDGQNVNFTSIIYTPRNCPAVKAGTKIRVIDEAQQARQEIYLEMNGGILAENQTPLTIPGDLTPVVRVEQESKRFSRDLLHCRIWA